jgi:hypothetical protein
MVHFVKSWPQFFIPIQEGTRHHELRLNDRDYQVGDYMMLMEWSPTLEEYTGRNQYVKITSITSREVPCAASGKGLDDDHCILSIEVI